jgi:predicted DNA-binding ribbon-helix-helix protein
LKGNLIKRSLLVVGHPTSVALEPEFWAVLDAVCAARGLTLSQLVSQIDESRAGRPLTSACRVFALKACADQRGS